MPRTRRLKIKGQNAVYHVRARAARHIGEYPLEHPECKQELERLIRFYVEAYFCELASYQILGSHYHAVILNEQMRRVSRKELRRRARLLYPKATEEELDRWDDAKWTRLKLRLFDISELMRNIQQAFARWYNKRFHRKGHFWAERFQSTLLVGERAVLEGSLYVDLNAFRAHLCDLPWEWPFGSAYHRENRTAGWLMPLARAVPSLGSGGYSAYKRLLVIRGGIASKSGDRKMPENVVQQALSDSAQRGLYSIRQPCFSRGLVLGSKEAVKPWLTDAYLHGRYRRQREPVHQSHLGLFSMRTRPNVRGES